MPYVKASLLALFVAFGSLRCNEGAADTPAVALSKAAPVFRKHTEERIRDTLATGVIERVEKGSGGRSLGFKLTFSGGVHGYFKPEQTFGANWNSEAAAYYVDRELGLGRVPPAVGRRIDWQELRSHAGKDRRLEEIVVRQGSVRGSVVWWIPEELEPADVPADWLGWLRVDRRFGASPFQSARDYWRDRKARRPTRLLDPPSPSLADRPAELSDLILFDYLIGNPDRWGSNNVNVQVLAGSLAALDALFVRHGVDLYASGHHHAYYPGAAAGIRQLSMPCLGAGPRALIGTARPSQPALVLLRVNATDVTELEAFSAPDFTSLIPRSALPPKIELGRHRLVRDDLVGATAPHSITASGAF